MPLPLCHRICARPLMISWVLGTLALWMVATVSLHREGVLPAALTELTPVLYLLLGYACLSGLGFFAGTFSVLWLVIRICRRVNGAPFSVGDQVAILAGPGAGTVTRVYALTRGQGGGLLPCVDLGPELAGRYRDIFEDYALLRVPGDGAVGNDPKVLPQAGRQAPGGAAASPGPAAPPGEE